jgi:hypothetical protein
MKLRFPENKIVDWAEKYDYFVDEIDLNALVSQVKSNRFLTSENLRTVARWKSPRSAGRVDRNDDDYVKITTGFSLETSNERARIEALTLLDGVLWPTASVILHFFHTENYPILDYRALWSVGAEPPAQYDFEFWLDYVKFCRELSNRTGQNMRTLDQALWAYSKQNQGNVGADSCSSA